MPIYIFTETKENTGLSARACCHHLTTDQAKCCFLRTSTLLFTSRHTRSHLATLFYLSKQGAMLKTWAFILLLPTSATCLGMTANSSQDQDIRGFVSEPSGRGTIGILRSCILTLLICLWTSIRINAPSKNHSTERPRFKAQVGSCRCHSSHLVTKLPKP